MLLATAAAGLAIVVGAGTSIAHECVNASKKNQSAGVQVVFDGETFQPVWMTAGLEKRVEQGMVDMDSGEGFRGLIGIDFDGDLVADVATYIVGPTGEIPLKAQFNGQPCKGITNIDTFFTECMGL
jgi:hypothetical protein